MNNEITVRITCSIQEMYNILENKGFNIIDEFSLNDTYLIPKDLKTEQMSSREILSNAIIIRNVIQKMPYKVINKITFKRKEFDDNGNILNQTSTNCEILNINDAKKLFEAIGYKSIMEIRENDVVYAKDGLQLAIKDIQNGEKLIEIETIESDKRLNTTDKLKQKINEVQIPVDTKDYFVKKAEIELKKILSGE